MMPALGHRLLQRRSRTRRSAAQPRPAQCFLFAGGGTGGHLFPGLAVASELADRLPGASIAFAGTGFDWERERVTHAGFEYFCVPSHPLPHNPMQLARALARNLAGYRHAAAWLKGRRVTAVIGLGGYGAFPAVLAARKQGVATFLLEQNVVPGKTTRWLARGAELVFTAFQDTATMLAANTRLQCAGNPVRREIARLRCPSETLRHPCRDRRTLLVTGGSQGARSLNRAVVTALSRLAGLHDRWQVIHQTGQNDYGFVAQQYARLPWRANVRPHFTNMAPLYQSTDLAVCRAGATTLSELACAGIPAVVLPYPYAAANHQHANARYYERHGAAVLVPDDREPQQTASELTAVLAKLLNRPSAILKMGQRMHELARPRAATEVAKQILICARVVP